MLYGNWQLFGITALAAYGLGWLARWAAPRLGWMDCPDGHRKLHTRPIPLLGGAAIYLALVSSVAMTDWDRAATDEHPGLWGLLLSAACYCVVGLWDDRWPLWPRTKLGLQVLATVPFLIQGGIIHVVSLFGGTWTLGPLAIPLTILWLVMCVNVVNLLDGLDGLAGSIGVIGLGTLSVIAFAGGHPAAAALGAIACGAVCGFLAHNWPPARLFLGDAGSMTIGFLIGALAIQGSAKTAAGFALVSPLMLVSVPVFDTLMAILRRHLTGQSLGIADRAHIHHRLLEHGLSRFQALLAVVSLCAVTAGGAVLARWLDRDLLGTAMCVSLFGLVIVSGVFGDREMLLMLRHVWAISLLGPRTGHALRTRWLWAKIRDANAPQRHRFLEAVRVRFQRAGGLNMNLQVEDRGHAASCSHPRTIPGQRLESPDEGEWEFSLTIARGDGQRVRLSAAGVAVGGRTGEHLEDIVRLLDEVCRHWPMKELTSLTGTTTSETESFRGLRVVRPDDEYVGTPA
ncbi:MAG TPA: MraY family glycosyltransferase, partial [Pirellulaceae bacterium]